MRGFSAHIPEERFQELTRPSECGREWVNLPTACHMCNPNGAHYHFADGSCDTEPCVRHGGPQ